MMNKDGAEALLPAAGIPAGIPMAETTQQHIWSQGLEVAMGLFICTIRGEGKTSGFVGSRKLLLLE